MSAAPCRGCPDRYTACSDRCRKPEFLSWKKQNEERKAAQRREGQIWGSTGDQIRKNRRIK